MRNPSTRQPGPGGGGPHARAAMAVERPVDFKGSLGRLAGFLRPYLGWLLVVLLLNILASALTAAGPKILSYATNEIARGAQAALSGEGLPIRLPLLGKILAGTLATYVFFAPASYASGRILARIVHRSMYDLRQRADHKLDRLPLAYFDAHPFGDTMSRITNDIDAIANALQQSLGQLVNAVLSVAMIVAVMLATSPWLALAGLAAMPLGALVSTRVIRYSQRYFRGQQKALGTLNGFIEESYNGHAVLKAFGREENLKARFAGLNDELYQNAWKAQFCSGIIMPVTMLLTNIGYVVIAVMGGRMAAAGLLAVGDIQAMLQYLRRISHPISTAGGIINILQSAVAAAERVFALLDQPEESPDSDTAEFPEPAGGDVVIRGVTFSYGDSPVLRDLSVRVHKGQRVAIVGPTGSGKTTLVNLLMRFYETDQGDILIDGVNIKDAGRRQLRARIGMVLQDTWLFKASILENIRYGRLSATDNEVVAAAKAACAHRFILQLPGGYDFALGEDASNISQGQRQLLTIARALLADREILILDEATSSVDTRTELLIGRATRNLLSGRTSFVIAHRLSTVQDADMILVLDDGVIVERGDHARLLERRGFYHRLYHSQFSQE